MSDQIVAEEQKVVAENPTSVAVKSEKGSAGCSIQGKSWIKGALAMAICCAAPLLVFAAIAFFRILSRNDRERGSESCWALGLSNRHVSHDADDDEGKKVESMSSKLWIKLGLVIASVGGIAALLAYGSIKGSAGIIRRL
jgi:hypothetical protein